MTFRALVFYRPLSLLALAAGLLISHLAIADLQIVDPEVGVFSSPPINIEDEDVKIFQSGPEEIESMQQIPVTLGTKFGIRFKMIGKNPNTQNVVKMLYLTPGLVDNQGERHDKFEVTKDLSLRAPYHTMAFQITERYEQVPGTWTFMIFENNRLVIKETFELVAE